MYFFFEVIAFISFLQTTTTSRYIVTSSGSQRGAMADMLISLLILQELLLIIFPILFSVISSIKIVSSILVKFISI